MRIGLIAYSSKTGLGYQTKEFYDNMEPHKTLVIDLSMYNHMPVDHSWYPDARITNGIPKNEDMGWLLQGMDIVFYCETPLNYFLHAKAKEMGVKVVQQFNPEFLDYHNKPMLDKPTILADPSTWQIEAVKELMQRQGGCPVEYLAVPVNRDNFQVKEIKKLHTILHVIGRPAYMDRNGTMNFLDLIDKVGGRYHWIISVQPPVDSRAIDYFRPVNKRLKEFSKRGLIDMRINVSDPRELYKEADLYVLPRRYGGLCLPMQEALSCGIPVIMPDISPNRDKLPEEWLYKANKQGNFYFHAPVDVYNSDDEDLWRVFNKFEDEGFIQKANEKANEIAEKYSWKNMKPKYLEFFEKL